MKQADLGFYKGIGTYPAEVYQSPFAQVVGSASTNTIYTYQGFDVANEFYSIDATGGYGLFFGKKILNNNVLFGTPSQAYVTPFIGVRYLVTDGDIDLIISLPVTNISGQNNFDQVTYSSVTLSTGIPAATGNIDTGINGLRLREDVNNIGNWYGAFPCVIFQSDSSTPAVGFNRSHLEDDTLTIIDFDFIPAFILPDRYYYFITTQKLYTCEVGDPAVSTEVVFPVANFVNLTCMASYQGNDATYRDGVVVGGFDSDASEYRILYFDTVTGEVFQYKAVGNGGQYKVNRIYYQQATDVAAGSVVGFWTAATDQGVFQLSHDTLDVAFIIDNTVVATDAYISYQSTFTVYHAIYTSTAGYWMFAPGPIRINFQSSKPFTCCGGYYNTAGDSTYMMAGGNDYLYYTEHLFGGPSSTTYLVDNSDYPWNDICFVGLSPSNPHIGLGAASGTGILDLLFTNPPVAAQIGTIYYLTYTLNFADLIKEDTYIYYGLLQLVGCGEADSAAALFKLDYEHDIYEVGDLEGNVTTNKLWIAANYFILNNTIDTNSLYYKSLLNLDLSELTGTQAELVGEDAGIFNTTEAGNVVDIIIDRSLFYILGTRAIEVWQNNGASGFPYRKQPYSTAKYHNFPQALSVNVNNISRFAPFQDGYIVATIDNSQNKLDILQMKNGASKPIPYNKNGWLQLVYNIGTSIEDVHVNTFKFYGEDYIAITFLDDNNGALGSAVINQKGALFFLQESDNFYQYLQSVSQTGIYTTLATTAITARFQDYIHSTLTPDISFPYQMTSQLLRPLSSQVMIKEVVIQYNFAGDVSGLSSLPDNSQYEVAYSVDGRSGTFSSFQRSFLLTERQIVVTINRQMPSFVLRFSTTIPMIIINAFVMFEGAGLK